MFRRLALIAILAASAGSLNAATTITVGNFGKTYCGSGANDNDVVIQTDGVTEFDTFQLVSSTGAVDVFVSVDGTNYVTSALSLADLGATTNDPVLVTSASRTYGFRGKYSAIRVLQNGATAANACLVAGKM